MILSSCSTTVVVKSKLLVPPSALTSLCEYDDFSGATQKDAILYIIYLQVELDKCNLKQEKELLWFERLQKSLDNDEKN